MSSLLDDVNQRTQLAGHNRLEILMFRLGGRQRYGINVFKVQEVIHCPPLTRLPNANPVVRGIVNIRGKTLSVIDLAMAIGKRPLADETECFLVVAEYNRVTQGFLVSEMDRIVNMNWEEIKPPPKGMGPACYLTAITTVDDEFVEIIDVEKVLADVTGMSADVSDETMEKKAEIDLEDRFILVVDDSLVARNQIKCTLDQLGVDTVMAKNGREGLALLQAWAKKEPHKLTDELIMVISDVEMPEMDGYTLTTEIRKDPQLASLQVVLHTSLSGVFNSSMVEKVGANKFISKYDADVLGNAVLEQIKQIMGRGGEAA